MLRAGLLAGCVCCLALAACASGGGGEVKGEKAATRPLGEVLARQLPSGEKYAVYVPAGEAPQGGWPCIVFLNGRGECGTDGKKQLTVGLMPAVKAHPERWPCVIVFPQKPDQQSLWSAHRGMVMAALNETRKTQKVDSTRQYLTGLSQGGAGTWAIAAASPGVFAAIAPICGWAESDSLVGAIGPGIGVWAFHGEADPVVPVQATIKVVETIAAQRRVDYQQVQQDDGTAAALRLTVYPKVGHDSWNKAYQESGVWDWLTRFHQ